VAAIQASGPVALPLLLLSVLTATLAVERGLHWCRLWQCPEPLRRQGRSDPWSTTVVEPLLEAVVLLAPLLGLLGTVVGVMGLLDRLGPQLPTPLAMGDVLASSAFGLGLSVLALALLLLNRGLRRWQRQLPPGP